MAGGAGLEQARIVERSHFGVVCPGCVGQPVGAPVEIRVDAFETVGQGGFQLVNLAGGKALLEDVTGADPRARVRNGLPVATRDGQGNHLHALRDFEHFRPQQLEQGGGKLEIAAAIGGADRLGRRRCKGQQGSGQSIGVAEISKTRKHVRGTVGLAHAGNPLAADSQIYIMKSASSPSLDGKHAIVGQVIKGMDVVDRIQKADSFKAVTIKAATPK